MLCEGVRVRNFGKVEVSNLTFLTPQPCYNGSFFWSMFNDSQLFPDLGSLSISILTSLCKTTQMFLH